MSVTAFVCTTSVLGWGTMIEGGKSRSVVVGREVVGIVCEHQQDGWLVRCIVVQGLVLAHGIGKFCSWILSPEKDSGECCE